MAAEARAESPAPAAPPPPVPEKRAAPADAGEDERPGPKRRRAFVATLDGVPCAAAAAAEEDGHRDGLSFSFQHSRGGFVPLETTPKFGSFNPPAPAEQQEAPDLDPKPELPAGEDSPVVEEEGEDPASPRTVAEDGNSEQQVATEVDQGEPERQDEPDCADAHHP
ncbi:sterile alpha motif domain-containing protein 1-like [Lolium rigidum]|uniref:sterile alpha motif domain-containing protein 1-like n=1 Tax=Lolium rigidum TaxID=89674 RepID=UPI001F5D607E|nr:sterile alpha motif domain-containing protein 1-like [Lolium rigidum]